METSDEGKGPVISIEGCSPMYPQHTCSLLNDYFRWVPDGISELLDILSCPVVNARLLLTCDKFQIDE